MSKRYFALIYYVGADFAQKRTAYREPHLKKVFESHTRGDLVLGDPPERALLIFRSDDRSAAESFANADPYVTSGLVQRWEVQAWNPVCGLREGDFDPLAGNPELQGIR